MIGISSPVVRQDWISCPHCEAPCRDREVPKGSELACARCGATVIVHVGRKTLQPSMALSLAGLLALVLANVKPVMDFEVVGRVQSGFLLTGVAELFRQGYAPIALLVAFAAVIAPLLHLLSVFYVSSACCLGLRLPFVLRVWRFASSIEPWNLIPVYSVATILSVVKLKLLGSVTWQFGARWVIGVAVFSLFAQQTFRERLVAERLRKMGIKA